MRKTYLLLLSVFLFTACSSDDDNNDPNGEGAKKVTLTLDATYYSDVDKANKPDAGSIVYIFEGFSTNNEGEWVYDGNGNFSSKKWGSSWKFTKSATVDNKGTAAIKEVTCPDKQKYFTIVVESASDKDKTDRYYPSEVFNFEDKDLKLKYHYGGSIEKQY